MRSRSRLIALVLVLSCFEPSIGQPFPADSEKATFIMRIRLVQNSVKPGAEVQVVVDITNTSDSPIHLVRAKSTRAPYNVRALDSAGKAAPLTVQERMFRGEAVAQDKGKPMRIRVGSGYVMTIAPGETAKDTIIIHDQVDLSQPGEYTIQLERVDPKTKIPVKSNTVTLTVVSDPSPRE